MTASTGGPGRSGEDGTGGRPARERSEAEPGPDDGWHRRRWTTIVLEEAPGGGWRATQTGVDVVGRGETAADAAAAYCRALSADRDGTGGEGGAAGGG